MQALVYGEGGRPQVVERPVPTIDNPTDAIVKMQHSSICGTDLHILDGQVKSAHPGRILGHEGVGVITELGSAIDKFKVGDTVLIACVTKCGHCSFCSRGIPSHCETGGWILGNEIDGTQAEYVKLPHANGSMYKIPECIKPEDAVALSDAFPTGMEAGAVNARVAPGKTVAIIGCGPVGLSALLTAKFYAPQLTVAIDLDDNRLDQARQFGVDHTANSAKESAEDLVARYTGGRGFDCVIEAVGSPKTMDIAQRLLGAGGDIANLGVHGSAVDLHMDKMWDRNFALRSKVVDATSIPTLIEMAEKGVINPRLLISHTFGWSEIDKAFDVFGNAAGNKALKVRVDFGK
ncbi:hypothetical protein KEM52_001830 [Ascosphaera acerosa]|nr:hypothetical protein KEM52_001830 [Ascosphaera acerosa]